jgi:hypothetical protein
VEGRRAEPGNQDRHNLTWNGTIARCTRQIPIVVVGVGSDTSNRCCEYPLGCSDKQVRYTVTCYFSIWAEVVPKFLPLELDKVTCTPFIVAQHSPPMDHSILSVVCRYDITNSDRCWDVILKAKTRSKVDIALQHPYSVAVLVPIIQLGGNESLRKSTGLVRNTTSNRCPLSTSKQRAWRYSQFCHIFSKLTSIVPSKTEKDG